MLICLRVGGGNPLLDRFALADEARQCGFGLVLAELVDELVELLARRHSGELYFWVRRLTSRRSAEWAIAAGTDTVLACALWRPSQPH
jgi:hypothetical protein